MVEKSAAQPAVAARVHQIEEHLAWLTDYVRNLDLSGDPGGEPPDLSAIEADIEDLGNALILFRRRMYGSDNAWAFVKYGEIANWESLATAVWGTAATLDALRDVAGTRKSIVRSLYNSNSEMVALLEDHGNLQHAIYGPGYESLTGEDDLGVRETSLLSIIKSKFADLEARVAYLETH